MVANRLVGLAKNRPELAARVPKGVRHELSKLYLDVVGVTTPGALQAVLDVVPMSNLLFGSDFPLNLYPRLGAEPEMWRLLAEAKNSGASEGVMGANAARLLRR